MSDQGVRRVLGVGLENLAVVFVLAAGLSGSGGRGAGAWLSLFGFGMVLVSAAVVTAALDQSTDDGTDLAMGAAGVVTHLAGMVGFLCLVLVVAGC